MLARLDTKALTHNRGSVIMTSFSIPDVRHGLGRPAKYDVICREDGSEYGAVHRRFMRFEDGERAAVRYEETAPDVLDTDTYSPAPPAV